MEKTTETRKGVSGMNQRHQIVIYDDEIKLIKRAIQKEIDDLKKTKDVTTNENIKYQLFEEIKNLWSFGSRLDKF